MRGEGAAALAAALKANASLGWLSLRYNNIREGAAAFCPVLRSASSGLWMLDLQNNDVGEGEASALLEAARENPAVCVLLGL